MNETPEYRAYRQAIDAAEEKFRQSLKAPGSEICVVCGAKMVRTAPDNPILPTSSYGPDNPMHPTWFQYSARPATGASD